jgi:hypothetical protein
MHRVSSCRAVSWQKRIARLKSYTKVDISSHRAEKEKIFQIVGSRQRVLPKKDTRPMQEFWLAPLVVSLRLPLLAGEMMRSATGQRPAKGRPESERMVTEKVDAVNEGLLGAASEAVKVQFELGLSMMTGNAPAFLRTAQQGPGRIAEAAMAPGKSRVRSNVRRLTAR